VQFAKAAHKGKEYQCAHRFNENEALTEKELLFLLPMELSSHIPPFFVPLEKSIAP